MPELEVIGVSRVGNAQDLGVLLLLGRGRVGQRLQLGAPQSYMVATGTGSQGMAQLCRVIEQPLSRLLFSL